MAVYALGDLEPDIDEQAYVHPDAVVIGHVVLGAEASVWPAAVLRGDDGLIEVGARTSIQDGTVIHTTAAFPTRIGADCVIGHAVHLEGCTVHDGALVGSGAVALHGAVVETGAIVGANAVLTRGTVVPAGALALGVPARITAGGADAREIARGAASYVDRIGRYRSGLRRLD